MTLEIIQIKKWLAKNLKLRTEGRNYTLRMVDPVPDGQWVIPIGRPVKKTLVHIQDGKVFIK